MFCFVKMHECKRNLFPYFLNQHTGEYKETVKKVYLIVENKHMVSLAVDLNICPLLSL
jgi:hypothetical protein